MFEEMDLLKNVRGLHSLAHSRLPTKQVEKKENVVEVPVFTKYEDGNWLIYTDQDDIAIALYNEYRVNPDFRDICLRGADVEDVVRTYGGFPPEAITDKAFPHLAMLWFHNPNPKCARCWKRYPEVNEDELCKRCDEFVPADHPSRGVRV